MAEWLGLDEAASRPGLAARPVAWRGGELVLRERFLAEVQAWRAAFAAVPGTRVALYFDDAFDFAAALYGAWHAGKTAWLPGDAQPATLERLLPQVDACAGALPGALQPLRDAPHAALEALDLRGAEVRVYTSGSSGEPVAIVKRLHQLDAEMRTLQAAFGATIDEPTPAVVHATVSHQHIYGLLFVALWPLAAGRPFVAERVVYPEEIPQRLGARPGVLVASPAHLKRLPDSIDWSAARAGLRAVFSSGGPLPPEAAQSSLDLLGRSPIEVFGSSETGGVAWRQRARHGDRWTALPGIDWQLDGELLAVRSPHLPDGEWFLTADRVRALKADEGGGFVLLGRADRIAKIEEKRVSLTAIEAALVACDEVAEARALVTGQAGTQRLAAVIVPTGAGWALVQREGKRALDQRLRAALLGTVERVALPRRWRHVRALPVNAQGKTTEAALEALFHPAIPVPEWIDRGAESARLALVLAPDLRVFEGHFPAAPLLPGVAQVDWAVSFGREAFALPPRFLRLEAIKFQRPALPGMRIELALQWSSEKRTLSFQYSSAAGPHSSGRIVFGDEE